LICSIIDRIKKIIVGIHNQSGFRLAKRLCPGLPEGVVSTNNTMNCKADRIVKIIIPAGHHVFKNFFIIQLLSFLFHYNPYNHEDYFCDEIENLFVVSNKLSHKDI
jgi:hypothetical protein